MCWPVYDVPHSHTATDEFISVFCFEFLIILQFLLKYLSSFPVFSPCFITYKLLYYTVVDMVDMNKLGFPFLC